MFKVPAEPVKFSIENSNTIIPDKQKKNKAVDLQRSPVEVKVKR